VNAFEKPKGNVRDDNPRLLASAPRRAGLFFVGPLGTPAYALINAQIAAPLFKRAQLRRLLCHGFEASLPSNRHTPGRRERPRGRAAEQRYEIAARHSITSSAATSSVCGTVRPSIRAVERLMTSSNFDDCTTGRSAGFAPLRTWPT
jgi:hypothetical protein